MNSLKLLLTITFSYLWAMSANAQPQYVAWAHAFGGTGFDAGNRIVATPDGGYIIVGTTTSTDSMLTGTGRTATQGTDTWVLKLDDTGGVQWHRIYGGATTGHDYGYAIRTVKAGGYVMTGYTNSVDGTIVDKRASFGYDFWVVRLANDGSITWSKTFGSSARDEAFDIRETSDGGFVVIGHTNNPTNGDISTAYGKYDFWVVKLNSSGGIEWEKSYGGTEADDGRAIRQTADGGYILAGSSRSSSGGVATQNKGETDYWVIKTNASGTVQWQKSYGGSGYDDAWDVIPSSKGGYVVVGTTSSQNGDINDALYGMEEAWILKLDDTGKIEWQRILGGSKYDIANSVEEVEDGYLIAGFTESKDGLVAEPYANGSHDCWIVKLDYDGSILWQKSVGGTGLDKAYSIYPTTDGGCVVVGETQSVNGDVKKAYGSADVFVAKLLTVPVDSVVVEVQGGNAPEITTAGGTLQLEATIYPTGLRQDVIWTIVPVTGAASIDTDGLVTGVRNGTVWGKATAARDASKADSVLITLSGQIIPIDSVVVRTKNGVAASITIENGTLQLEAVVYPSNANQQVNWSVVAGTGAASMDANGVLTAQSNGTVWAKAVSASEPDKMDSLQITIDGQNLAVLDVNRPHHIIVYPNPAQDKVVVSGINRQQSAAVKVSDIYGRVVQQLPAVMLDQPFTFDMSGVAAGVYYVIIKADGVDFREKLVKQ